MNCLIIIKNELQSLAYHRVLLGNELSCLALKWWSPSPAGAQTNEPNMTPSPPQTQQMQVCEPDWTGSYRWTCGRCSPGTCSVEPRDPDVLPPSCPPAARDTAASRHSHLWCSASLTSCSSPTSSLLSLSLSPSPLSVSISLSSPSSLSKCLFTILCSHLPIERERDSERERGGEREREREREKEREGGRERERERERGR